MSLRTIVCLGNSITAAKSVGVLEGWPALLQIHLSQTEKWKVYNRGVPGETIRDAGQRLEKDVTPLLPAFVLIEFGINDSSFLRTEDIPRVSPNDFGLCLEQVARRIKSAGGHPLLMVNHPLGQKDPLLPNRLRRQKHLDLYHTQTRTLARKAKYPLVDLHHRLASTCMRRWRAHGLSHDGVHLTRRGHQLYAHALFQELTPLFTRTSKR